METNPHRFAVEATDASHFAWLRTRMSLDRTMMAWMRTATALIGFGFTIVLFFERFGDMTGVAPAARPFASRYVGLVLIAAGVSALVLSAFQYRKTVRYVWQREFAALARLDKPPGATPVFAIAVALIFIGVFTFMAVLVRAV
jgi:putative membrane protein